jgi:hypothetical protein
MPNWSADLPTDCVKAQVVASQRAINDEAAIWIRVFICNPPIKSSRRRPFLPPNAMPLSR